MSETIRVTNATELYSALSRATGGETILLASGDYGTLTLDSKTKFDRTWSETVTIKSESADQPASLSRVKLDGVENLTFDGVKFDYDFSDGTNKIFGSDTTQTYLVNVGNSANITIRNSVFDGDVASGTGTAADGYGAATALGVGTSKDVLIENNEIYNFQRGLGVSASTDVTIRGNDIHTIRHDGMNIIQMTGVVIEENYLHDFKRSPTAGDHVDMIQFWTNGKTVPTTDVVIRGNILDIGDGQHTQSIFMRNEAVDSQGGGKAMYYQNVTITDNVIVNGHLHGITVGETAGLVITGNTVVQGGADWSGHSVGVPKISIKSGSEDVTVTGNTVSSISGYNGQSSWTVGDNTTIQTKDASAPGYHAAVLAEAEQKIADHLDGGSGGSIGQPPEEPVPNLPPPPPVHDYDLDFDGLDTFLESFGRTSLDTTSKVLNLDGKGYGWLGRMHEFGDTDQLAMTVDFKQDTPGNGKEILVWNHQKLGVTIDGDGLIIHAGTTEGFKAFKLKNLGLKDQDEHSLTVQIDAENDRLQVVLDGKVVLDEQNTDFEIVGAGGRQWGWHLGGNPWNAGLDGTISDFTLDRSVDFDDFRHSGELIG